MHPLVYAWLLGHQELLLEYFFLLFELCLLLLFLFTDTLHPVLDLLAPDGRFHFLAGLLLLHLAEVLRRFLVFDQLYLELLVLVPEASKLVLLMKTPFLSLVVKVKTAFVPL